MVDHEDNILVYRLNQAELKIKAMEEDVNRQKKVFDDYTKSVTANERRNLVWGIGVLGSITLGLLTLFWNNLSKIMPG